MPDNLNTVNDVQSGNVDTQSVQDTGVQSGTADQKPVQTQQENAAFAEMRRKIESYEPIVQKATQYESALQKAARITNFESVEAYLKAVDEAEQEAEAKQYQQAGADPKAIEKLLNDHPVIKQTQDYFNKARIAEEKAALKDKKFYKELEPDIDKVLAANPQLSAQFVYEYVRGQKLEELIAGELTKAQQAGAEGQINQSKRGTESNDNPAVDEKTLDFTADEKAWADRRVKQGTYKNLKEAHDFLRGKAGVKMR
jgi:vacuolar-type H+-ATPase subunit I/STV1